MGHLAFIQLCLGITKTTRTAPGSKFVLEIYGGCGTTTTGTGSDMFIF